MSEDQRPPSEPEPIRLDSGELKFGAGDATYKGEDHADSDPSQDGLPGKRIGDYELLRELGRGGMGIVFEARQVSLNRGVALKVLPPGLGLTGTAVQRFEREAHAAAKLHHTGIVPVYAIGEEDGCHYYAMELIEGQALSEVLSDLTGQGSNPLLDGTVTRLGKIKQTGKRHEPDSGQSSSGITSLSDSQSGSRKWFDAVAKLISEVADALEYAHGRGVIHRDIKPANLMLSSDGHLCITDFGLARVAQEPGMTVSGSLMGTPAYMSPEQIAVGRMKLDHRTDIYSLGAVLYEMLTHRRPFPGESREEILGGILTKDPRPPRRINPRIPVDLETICQKAMEKDQDRRYPSAGDFADDLRQYLQDGLISARRAGPLRRTWKAVRRHPLIATTAIALILLTAAGGLAWRSRVTSVREEARRTVTEAVLDLENGRYREGLEKVDRALELHPELDAARIVRARLLMILGRTREAAEDAAAVLEANPEDWSAHLILAGAGGWEGSGNKSAGIPVEEHLRAVERLTPETAEAFYARAMGAEEGPIRVKLLNHALELNAGHPEALKARIKHFSRMRDFSSALADCERLIAVRPRSTEGRREKAKTFILQRDYDRALAEIEDAIRIDPGDGNNYRVRSDIYLDTGRLEEQYADLTRAMELGPGSMAYPKVRADNLNQRGRYEEAIVDARRSIEANPELPYGYAPLFTAFWNLNRREELLASMSELRQKAGEWVVPYPRRWAYTRLSQWYLQLGDHDEALAMAECAVEVDRGPVSSVYALRARAGARRRIEGSAAFNADCERISMIEMSTPEQLVDRANLLRDFCRRPDLALEDYEKAIELAPSWVDPYSQRAVLHRFEKRHDEALADLNRALELQPNWHEAIYNRALVYADLQRFDEALADYRRMFDAGAEKVDGRWNQAIALLHVGREKEALAALDTAIKRSPRVERNYRRLAQAQFRLGRVGEALESIDRAIEVEPTAPWPRHYRAFFAQFGSVSCVRIRDDMDRAIELMPDSAEAWNLRAGSLLCGWLAPQRCADLHDPARALELARKAVVDDAKNADYQQVLGEALYLNDRFAEARDALERAVEIRLDEGPFDLFLLAMASSRLGDAQQARRYYDRAVTRMDTTFPRDPRNLGIKEEAGRMIGVGP